jgi:uncharacterized protein YegJ (DUF2314 family)
MTTSYFTFGQDHAHRVGDFTYDKDVIVKVTANDPRAVMFATFGRKWSMQYCEADIPNMIHHSRKI